MPIRTKKIFLRTLVISAVFLIVLVFVRHWILVHLPEDQIEIPFSEIEIQPEIPPRPGVQGIEISGPEIKVKRFEIDLSRSGLESLNWKQLMTVDPHAQIIVQGMINPQGRLIFSPSDIRIEGHPQAGMMILMALKTWVYTPLKSGQIQFTFNLPSEGRKLMIDATGLKRKNSIPLEVPILDGLLYYIDGIPAMETRLISSND